MLDREFKEALGRGQRVYGTLIVSTSPKWVEATAMCGLDFVFLDTEHIPVGRETLSWMSNAYRAAGLAPIVRIPSPDPYEACVVLDGGASGVIAPYIESPEQVRDLVGATKLRPLKGRRLAARLAGESVEPELEIYLGDKSATTSLIINIESRPALEDLDAIFDVPGLDGVLIGPHDLTCSLGIPEQYDHPEYLAAVDRIVRSARARGISAGVHAVYQQALEHELRFAKAGANLFVHQADLIAYRNAVSRDVARLRTELGDEIEVKQDEIAI